MIYTLGGLPGGFTLADLSNVSAQFGTSLDEPNIVLVPEPNTLLLLASGLVGLSVRRRFTA